MKGNTDINSAIGAATAKKNYDFEQLECERLQTLDDGYTDKGVSNTHLIDVSIEQRIR